MSSTCNIAGCKNDCRPKIRARQIVMPHVKKLHFHKPREEDFGSWQGRLDENRDNYKVSGATRVCSNRFNNGSYKKGDIPHLYMRGYPSWASSREGLQKQAAALDDGIVREVAAHAFQSLPSTSPIRKTLLQLIPDCDISNDASSSEQDILTRTILTADPSVICNILCQFLDDVSIGKVQEAIAIYKHGQWFEKSTINLKLSVQLKPEIVNKSNACAEEMECDALSLHNYCDNAHSTEKPTHVHKNKKCMKSHCTKEKKDLLRKLNVMRSKCKQLTSENEKLEHKNMLLKEDLKHADTKIDKLKETSEKRGHISINDIKKSNELVKLHTGLQSINHFNWLYHQIESSATKLQYWKGESNDNLKNYMQEERRKPGPSREMSVEEELLVTLMLLKLNLLEEHMAFLFGVSAPTISQIISTWLPFLALELCPLIHWPATEDIPQCYPACFEHWSNITAIIDCFEVPTEKPSHIEANSQIFSGYKNRATVKFLIACTPGGSISYISPPAGGNMSDVELVRQTELPLKFTPGDACLADKGFRMEGDFIQQGVRLIIPPFVKKGKQFTSQKVAKNKHIAHARIHVERVIGRVRDYQILNSVVPISRLDIIGPAATVCCALTNLKESVVRPKVTTKH